MISTSTTDANDAHHPTVQMILQATHSGVSRTNQGKSTLLPLCRDYLMFILLASYRFCLSYLHRIGLTYVRVILQLEMPRAKDMQ